MIKKFGVANKAFTYIVFNFINACVPFALLFILTNKFEPEVYGRLSIYQSLVTIFGSFVGLNTVGYVSVESKKSHGSISEALRACYWILLFGGVFCYVLLFVFRAPIIELTGVYFEWIIVAFIVAAGIFLINIALVYMQFFEGAISYGVLQISHPALGLFLSYIFIVIFDFDENARVYSNIVAVLFVAGCAMFFVNNKLKMNFLPINWSKIKEALFFGIPLIPHTLGMVALGVADRFFINKYYGSSQVGVYMVAIQYSSILVLVFDAINRAYVPWLFDLLNTDVSIAKKKNIVKITYICFALIVIVAYIFYICSESIIGMIEGGRYNVASECIFYLLCAQVFLGAYLLVVNYIFYTKKTVYLSFATGFSIAVNVMLLFYLVPLYGINGGAISFMISMFVRFVLVVFLANRCYPMPWFSFR